MRRFRNVRNRQYWLFVLAVVAFAAQAARADAPLGIAGTWHWDAQRSSGQTTLLSSLTVSFTKDDGQGLAWHEEVIKADGKKSHLNAEATFGGPAQVVEGVIGLLAAITRDSVNQFTVTYTLKVNQMWRETCTLATDDHLLTCRGPHQTANGGTIETINIFNR